MEITEAIEQAEKFTEGATFHAGSQGWKTVMAVLLAEVKKQKEDYTKGFNDAVTLNEKCTCHACQIAEETNEPQGPLHALLLADTIDQQADELINTAGELNIYGIQYETESIAIATFGKSVLLRLAARIRAEHNRNQEGKKES